MRVRRGAVGRDGEAVIYPWPLDYAAWWLLWYFLGGVIQMVLTALACIPWYLFARFALGSWGSFRISAPGPFDERGSR